LISREELDVLRATAPQPIEKERPSDLPKWARLALARCVLYEETIKEAAAHFGKGKSILEKYSASPGGKLWRAKLSELAADPVFIAEALIRSNAVGVTFDAFWALEAAKAAEDYKEVGVISRDLMDRIPEIRKSQAEGARAAPQIVIQLGGASLEPLAVETEHTRSVEAEYLTIDAEIVED
jgi:hypothetical protein